MGSGAGEGSWGSAGSQSPFPALVAARKASELSCEMPTGRGVGRGRDDQRAAALRGRGRGREGASAEDNQSHGEALSAASRCRLQMSANGWCGFQGAKMSYLVRQEETKDELSLFQQLTCPKSKMTSRELWARGRHSCPWEERAPPKPEPGSARPHCLGCSGSTKEAHQHPGVPPSCRGHVTQDPSPPSPARGGRVSFTLLRDGPPHEGVMAPDSAWPNSDS